MEAVEYKLTFKDFNDSLKNNRLLGLKCNDCGKFTCPPKMTCQECGSTNLEPAELTGMGKVVTYTTSYVPGQGRDVEAPILIVMVELDEGPWIMGNLVNEDPNQVTMESLIGKRVKLGPRSKVFPGDAYSTGKEAKGGIARVTFVTA
jgi:hypothetical protein